MCICVCICANNVQILGFGGVGGLGVGGDTIGGGVGVRGPGSYIYTLIVVASSPVHIPSNDNRYQKSWLKSPFKHAGLRSIHIQVSI